MWPFTSRRIFGNRWWAVAFAVFVSWQAAETVQSFDDSAEASNSATAGDGAQADIDALRQRVDQMKAMQSR